MKTVLAILVAAALGFGAGWLYLSRAQVKQAGQVAANEAGWEAEKAFLERSLAEARQRQGSVRTVTQTLATTITNRLQPGQILEQLIKLNPNTSDEARNRVFRHIVFHLQGLVELGPESIPVIQGFLKENKDVDYSMDALNESGERVARAGFQSRNIARTDFLVPPSLRLGLIDALAQIGGEQSEAALAEVLDTTGRGVEVAFIAKVLQEEAPDKYKDNALKAAKDLLANPPPLDQPNHLDENSRAYLYSVLTMFGDTSFADTAQGLVVTEQGRIDKQAVGYLNGILKDKAGAALCTAYKDPRLTNRSERATLMNAILTYAGPSPEANQVFQSVLLDESIPAGIRAFTVQGLAGGSGSDRPSDPKLIESRIDLLRSYRGSLKDEKLLHAMDDTQAALEKLLAGQGKP